MVGCSSVVGDGWVRWGKVVDEEMKMEDKMLLLDFMFDMLIVAISMYHKFHFIF